MTDREEVPQDIDIEQAADDAADARKAAAMEAGEQYTASAEPFEKPPGPDRREDMLEPEPGEPKYRDAETGEYVTEAYAKANPATTVREED